MSASFGLNNLHVEAFGQKTTVPNNNVARLMYYLDCVSTVIEYDEYNKLTDYQHYYNLTIDEMKEVYKLAILMNPKLFVDAGIFIVNPSLLPEGLSNQFYKITDERIGVHVNQEIMIGGRTVKVLNCMVCDSSWIKRNYVIPLEDLINEIEKRLNPGKPNYPIVDTETSIVTKNEIIVNQITEFRTHPVSLICPNCKNCIMTSTKSEINFLACCCFLMFGILYILCQACNDKNCCCCNVIHSCPKCGAIVGKYDAC